MTNATHEEQTAALVERLSGDLLGAMTTYSVYIGDRLNLYRALAEGGPATSAELASRAGIAERYAREWMEQQAADGILDLVEAFDHPSRRCFKLSSGHAEVLTDGDSLSYFAPLMRLLVAGGNQLPQILDAYRTGTGVPWSADSDDMREAMGDANRPMYLGQLATEYLPQIGDVHARLQQPGARVADIGSGMGWSSIGIAEGYPNAQVDGYDLDARAVERAKGHADARGVSDRVTFHARDGVDAEGTYDLVTAFECIHDMPQPVQVLSTMRQLAGADGTVIVMDEAVADTFEAPANEVDRMMYGYSLLICLPDGLSHPPSVGTGTVMRQSTFEAYAHEAGFTDVEVLPFENDFFRFYRLK